MTKEVEFTSPQPGIFQQPFVGYVGLPSIITQAIYLFSNGTSKSFLLKGHFSEMWLGLYSEEYSKLVITAACKVRMNHHRHW